MAKGSRLQPLARAVLRTQSDERLVRLVREGRDAAFEEIVRRYRQPLVAFAAAYTPGDPEDVVQDSLTRSWQALRESTGEMNLKPWLYTIVRNRALNARRDTRFHDELTDQVDGVRQPADIVLTNDELARVVTAVGALPDHQREALVRSALEGHTHEQIATAIGTTPGAVRQLIFRGRNTVRQGVGLLIPLPLVRLLAESGAAEATGAGAAAASSGAILAGGGGSLATKAAIVAAVGAIAAGSGVAIERSGDGEKKPEPVKREQAAPLAESQLKSQGPAVTATAVPVDARSETSSSGRDGSDDGPSHDAGDDHGGEAASSGPISDDGSGEDSSASSGGGPGPSSSSDSSDSSDSSGDGSDDSGDDSSGSPDSSGSSSGHGSSDDSSDDGGGSSGPSGSDDEVAEAPDPSDSSGPGGGDDDLVEVDGSSDSSDGSGSSGPGSDPLAD